MPNLNFISKDWIKLIMVIQFSYMFLNLSYDLPSYSVTFLPKNEDPQNTTK